MPVQYYEEGPLPVHEAEENLRVIREFMERSTRHSTFSGLSGVSVGLLAIAGCLVQYFGVLSLPPDSRSTAFVINWGVVFLLAVGADFLITKRRAPSVGKTIASRLGRQMFLAASPGLGTGGLLTLYFLQRGMMNEIYPFWMLCYGSAVCAVGLFSQRDVGKLGWAFLASGTITLVFQLLKLFPPAPLGLAMLALSAGGFHIMYGIAQARRDGWS